MMHADGIAGGRLGDAAGPGGNGAGGVAGALGAERGEIVAEPRGLIGGASGPQTEADDAAPRRANDGRRMKRAK